MSGRGVLRASGKAVWRWPPVVAADAGPMQIQLGEGRGFEVCRGCAAGHNPSHHTPRNGLRRESIAKVVVEEAARKDLFGGEPKRYGARRGTQSFRVRESGFMQQRRTKSDFSSGEPFDDLHWPTTLGAAIKIRGVFGGGSLVFGLRFLHRAEQLNLKRQE